MVLDVVLALIGARALAQLWLERLNRAEVLRHAGRIPEAFRGAMDEATYRKAADYTLAKGRFNQFEIVFDALVLAAVLASGILPVFYAWFLGQSGGGAAAHALFLLAVGVLLSLPSMPLNWAEQFRLEERFGFNNSTQATWWLDRAKGLALSLVLGFPLLLLILKLVEWTGAWWWLWAFGLVLGFQLLMVVLAPIVIMPLFNKFTPLPEGDLRNRLLKLGERTGFHSRSIQVMDGSKRSKHSNAFFTGFGKLRKIVLFDTLIAHLQEQELEAVLAHEIGHYKKRHIPKMLAGSALGLLAAFFVIAQLAQQPWFYRAFGFAPQPGSMAPALLLFTLLSGLFTFWFSPLMNMVSRRFEYQADAYARETMGGPAPLIAALRKLNEKNLSNLTPHPSYSAFYYSHPTLLERERALLSATT
jgi:STE24 endopeptidase